ncbi:MULTISPECIES: helix-turn-helix domain-containing protein [Paraburkholderia]|uniref:Transcriptional regulator with XRE-family HTH domain n=1 Tax=Paraburkholderia youngii TaxID=2782701 RepID=A0A7W8LFL2_9BURK|nr:helix-turn-helix transcriptional regulator [Paraburkholderia youngii]MBB5404739.1 transcriptional regulator with XRE-family HTH domain [Paraburkholderia youngii]
MRTLVKEFGLAVRDLRAARARSQEQLAELAGLSRSYVSEVERGTVVASLDTIDKLARAFGLAAAELLAQQDARLQKPLAPPDESALPN